ncbi:hypothetical protein WMW72_11250 [Paenibacillus filicis]|uniref:Copper amine oxidase-like N-terminal domain-containing protein n=1 Tax=Paenibacillus filicis TaxID=669464 RepID=A0ABU9DHY7_9BACL
MNDVKKFVIGVMAGAILSLSATSLATNLTDVSLFPVKYVFNDIEKPIPTEYSSINYNGHAYVPIRFIAENTNLNIGYDETGKRVLINYGIDGQNAAPIPPQYQEENYDPNLPYKTNNALPYGNIKVTKEGLNSLVSFQLLNDIPDNDMGGVMRFYDSQANFLGQLLISQTFSAGINTYNGEIVADLSTYKYATLSFGKVQGAIYRPAAVSKDVSEKNAIGGLTFRNYSEEQIKKLGVKLVDVFEIIAFMRLNRENADDLVN